MCEYDSIDESNGGDIFYGFPKDYIRLNDVRKYFEVFPFYIKEYVDNNIGSWDKFFDDIIENGELPTYDLRLLSYHGFWAKVDDFPNEEVEIRKSDWLGGYIRKKDFFDIARYYGISDIDKCKGIMEKALSFYQFMLDVFDESKGRIKNDDKLPHIEHTQTSKALEKRQENALSKWKSAFRMMVDIRDQCLAEGPKKRTERELWKMFENKGYKIQQNQMDFFKTLLTEDYVDKTGGAPKQGKD